MPPDLPDNAWQTPSGLTICKFPPGSPTLSAEQPQQHPDQGTRQPRHDDDDFQARPPAPLHLPAAPQSSRPPGPLMGLAPDSPVDFLAMHRHLARRVNADAHLLSRSHAQRAAVAVFSEQ